MTNQLFVVTLLTVSAFLLFFFEIFLPGGILAVIGMVLLVGGTVVTGTTYGIGAATIFLFASIAGAVVMFFLEIKFLQKGPFAKFFLHQSSNQAVSNKPVGEESLVGMQGEVVTRMAPSGKIRIDGKIYVASSESGMLESGQLVSVVRIDPFRIIVRKI